MQATLFPESVSLDAGAITLTAALPGALNSDDGDASYLEMAGAGPERHALANLPAGAGRIVAVTWSYKGRANDGSTAWKSGIYEGGAYSWGSNKAGTGYVLYSDAQASPPSGGSWTSARVNATEGAYDWAGGTGVGIITLAGLTVDYVPLAGCFSALVFEVFGPLAAVGLAEIPRLCRELERRRAVRLSPLERLELWREFRELRSPRYYFRPAAAGAF